MNKDIPTPRTDAAKWLPENYIGLEVVSANFSETLEKELYIANERIKELEQGIDGIIGDISRIPIINDDE